MPTDERIEVLVLVAETGAVGVDEMVRMSGLTRDMIEELAEAGCFSDARRHGEDWQFDTCSGSAARRALRLRRDFGLDDAGVALAVTLFTRIERLEARMQELQCQLLRGAPD